MHLAQLYEQLDDHGRKALATGAGISVGYLWQLATHWKGKKPSVDLIADLVQADPRLTVPELVAEFATKRARTGGQVAVAAHASPLGAS